MALSISTTNVLTGQTPVVTDPGTNEVASNISSSDHSLTYTCGTAVGDFQVDYGHIRAYGGNSCTRIY